MAADMLYATRADFAPEVARSAELLQAEVDRFESLLVDLLEISRYDAGVAVLEEEASDVRALVLRTADGVRTLAERAGSELRLHLPDTPVVAEVDPRRIERILRNLIGNALDHGEGRPIDVSLAGDADAVALSVRDHGVGLRPEETGQVFERFWRADLSRARQTGGTGLGLSISLEDARLHGGRLQVWGAPGRGALFRLTVPRRAGGQFGVSPLPLVPPDALSSPAPAAAEGRA
jgi:two-component system sensor histidine kinase MtrB